MTDDERMMAGKLYDPYKVENNPWNTIRAACKKFNDSEFWNDRTAFEELKSCFAEAGEDMWLTPPLYCDYGSHIYFGKHFYANTGLTILDENEVRFGDNVFLGPRVSIYTSGLLIEHRDISFEWIGGTFYSTGFYLYAQLIFTTSGSASSPDPNIYYRTLK